MAVRKLRKEHFEREGIANNVKMVLSGQVRYRTEKRLFDFTVRSLMTGKNSLSGV